MKEDQNRIEIDGVQIEIRSLLDLHANWSRIRGKINRSIDGGEIEDPNLRKIIQWLVVLGEKTMFRTD